MITKQGKQFFVIFAVNGEQVIELLDKCQIMGVKPIRLPLHIPIGKKIPVTTPEKLAARKKKTVKVAGK